MATPNLVNIATITPFTIAGQVTTSATDVIDTSAETCRKINSIIISNVDGSNSADVTVEISVDNGSNYRNIAIIFENLQSPPSPNTTCREM